MKKLLPFIITLFLSFSLHAQEPSAPMTIDRINYVASVKLSGVELDSPMTYRQMRKLFSGSIVQDEKSSPPGCADYMLSVEFQGGKDAQMEFSSEKQDLAPLFSDQNTARYGYQRSNIRGNLWRVNWDDIHHFTETLLLGDIPISANLTEDEFKRLFPLSSKMGVTFENEEEIEVTIYYIAYIHNSNDLALMQSGSSVWAPYYDGTIIMTFSDGKLFQLFIGTGSPC